MICVICALLVGGAPLARAAVTLKGVESARLTAGDNPLRLFQQMQPQHMSPSETPQERVISIDRSRQMQSIVGFGGAFTEASAINWRSLPPQQRDEVIRLYFGPASAGGLEYSVGRVPINSCDFSPTSYSFNDVAGDVRMEHFDTSVKHDADSILPMILAAQEAVRRRGGELRLIASPWSPPAWMKAPVDQAACRAQYHSEEECAGEPRKSMTLSASPNGARARPRLLRLGVRVRAVALASTADRAAVSARRSAAGDAASVGAVHLPLRFGVRGVWHSPVGRDGAERARGGCGLGVVPVDASIHGGVCA